MNIDYYAQQVSCSQAIDWEIVQVEFDSVLDGELDDMQSDRKSPCLMIGENFEFPGAPQGDWHDGTDWGGGVGIRMMELSRNKAFVDLKTDLSFSISFDLSNERYDELKEYLRILFQRSPRALVIEEGDGTTTRSTQFG